MEQRNRNNAVLLIGAGLYLLLGLVFSFFTVTAILLVLLSIYQLRLGESKTGYIVLAVGLVMLLSNHFVFFVAAALIGAGYYYYYKGKATEFDAAALKRHNILESLKYNKEQWELRDMSIWSFIGEIYMDLSLAMLENKETNVIIQGGIGDIDIIVPDDIGVSVEASVLIGQTVVDRENEAGLLNKVYWKSRDYDESEYKVRFVISYFIGDIHVRVL